MKNFPIRQRDIPKLKISFFQKLKYLFLNKLAIIHNIEKNNAIQ